MRFELINFTLTNLCLSEGILRIQNTTGEIIIAQHFDLPSAPPVPTSPVLRQT